MQTKPLPEIEPSDLKAVREFLTSFREEERKERTARVPQSNNGAVALRNGISRARNRSVTKASA
jgi:hypothetical protein